MGRNSSTSSSRSSSRSRSNKASSGGGSKRRRKASSNSSSSDQEMWNTKSKKKKNSLSGINESAAEKLFDEIADEEDPGIVSMEGIFLLGQKLNMDATEDIRILVLLWKMGANEKPAQISKNEWMQGCAALQVDSWAAFTKLLPALDTGFLDRTEFKDFYKFCFQFNRQGTHRTLDKDMVVALLQMVLKDRIPEERRETFCTFCSENAAYTRITLDQWTSFLDFCYEVEDLSAYDESTSAWPVLIDEYVEYMEGLAKMKT